jgi:hypothetical protein
MRWAGDVAHMGDRRVSYKVLVGKPDRKSPLGRPRRTWDNNINLGLQEVGLETLDWIYVAQNMDRCRDLVNAVRNLLVPLNVGGFFTS